MNGGVKLVCRACGSDRVRMRAAPGKRYRAIWRCLACGQAAALIHEDRRSSVKVIREGKGAA